eukprot:5530629-Pleurochrysis_carterae.AAC.3
MTTAAAASDGSRGRPEMRAIRPRTDRRCTTQASAAVAEIDDVAHAEVGPASTVDVERKGAAGVRLSWRRTRYGDYGAERDGSRRRCLSPTPRAHARVLACDTRARARELSRQERRTRPTRGGRAQQAHPPPAVTPHSPGKGAERKARARHMGGSRGTSGAGACVRIHAGGVRM